MALHPSHIKKASDEFGKQPYAKLAKSILANLQVSTLENADAIPEREFRYHTTPYKLKVLDQKQTGRCWIFAFTNLIRRQLIAKKKVNEDFKLSYKYILFYDKLEKCNALLEVLYYVMGKGAGEAPDSLFIMNLRDVYISDGGTWDFFKNIVYKYGVVPYEAFPENLQSTHTRDINRILNNVIGSYCGDISKLARKGLKTRTLFEGLKKEAMAQCYKIIEAFFGKPPTEFTLNLKHGTQSITPTKYFKHYIDKHVHLNDYAVLINDPRKPYYKMYTVELMHNVIDDRGNIQHQVTNRFFNVPIDVIQGATLRSIKHNIPVPFAADIKQFTNISDSRLDTDVPYEELLGFSLVHPKRKLYDNRISEPNHAMLIIGANGEKGEWQVENSWGVSNEDYPYLTMTNDWFEHYVGEAMVKFKHLPPKLQRVYKSLKDKAPHTYTFYKFWDVFGSLSR